MAQNVKRMELKRKNKDDDFFNSPFDNNISSPKFASSNNNFSSSNANQNDDEKDSLERMREYIRESTPASVFYRFVLTGNIFFE